MSIAYIGPGSGWLVALTPFLLAALGAVLLLAVVRAIIISRRGGNRSALAAPMTQPNKPLQLDESKLPPVENGELLVNAMGYWPSFHDAHVLSASLEGGRCEVLIYVFRMTDQVDDRGYFVLTGHHRVRLAMTGVAECTLPDGYDSDTLFELMIERAGEAVTVTFESVMDQDWRVTCREVVLLDVTPCGPRGKLAIQQTDAD
jgi:hypothetical protein